jgi:hypothetical protein
MTMARIKDDKVVAVGLPDSLESIEPDRLYALGWRQVKGLPKPTDGSGYEYTHPYTYNADEDAVYGTWQQTDVIERTRQKARNRAKLSRAEFKLALLERDELENVKTAMSDANADPRAVILWEDANEFWRTNKDLLALASELGYTEEQLDDIFGINS